MKKHIATRNRHRIIWWISGLGLVGIIAFLSNVGGIAGHVKTWFYSSKPVQENSPEPSKLPIASSPSPSPITTPEVLAKLEDEARSFEELAPSPTPVKPPGTVGEPATTTVTPNEIYKQEPLMREDFAKQLIGVPFDWILDFDSAHTRELPNGEKSLLVFLRPPEKEQPLVAGELPLARVGELNTLTQGTKIRIKGTIEAPKDELSSISVKFSEFTILREYK